MKIPTIDIYGDRAWISFESFPSLTEIENVQMVQFWLSWFRLAVSSEQKVPLVMFANIVCSSVSRNAGLGGGVAGVGGKRSLLGNSLAGVLVELRTARRHTSHTHWPTGHPKETSSCFPTFIVCTLGIDGYGYTELLDIQD